jgi:hypothetical protein
MMFARRFLGCAGLLGGGIGDWFGRAVAHQSATAFASLNEAVQSVVAAKAFRAVHPAASVGEATVNARVAAGMVTARGMIVTD